MPYFVGALPPGSSIVLGTTSLAVEICRDKWVQKVSERLPNYLACIS